jgi:hypothetical protein
MDLLAPSQVDQLRTVFAVFSVPASAPYEGLAVVGSRQLASVLAALGCAYTDAEVAELVAASDTRGRDFLDFNEFVQLMCGELKDTVVEAEVVEAFAGCSSSGRGGSLLTVEDVAALLASSAPPGTAAAVEVPLTRSDIEGIVFEAAGPKAAGIDLEAFTAMVRAQQ